MATRRYAPSQIVAVPLATYDLPRHTSQHWLLCFNFGLKSPRRELGTPSPRSPTPRALVTSLLCMSSASSSTTGSKSTPVIRLSFIHYTTGTITKELETYGLSGLTAALHRFRYEPLATFLPGAPPQLVGSFWITEDITVPSGRLPELVHGLQGRSLIIFFLGRECPRCTVCNKEDEDIPFVGCKVCYAIPAWHHRRCCARARLPRQEHGFSELEHAHEGFPTIAQAMAESLHWWLQEQPDTSRPGRRIYGAHYSEDDAASDPASSSSTTSTSSTPEPQSAQP